MDNVLKKQQKKVKLKKGDEVVVLTGRSKGSKGAIERIDRKHDKVYIGGVNIYKKHVKPDASRPEGGIIDKPMPIHISNVSILDPKTKKPTRIGYQINEDGKKVRIAKASGSVLDK